MSKTIIEVRSALNYDAKAASKKAALSCLDPSRTVQSQKDEADINVIVKRFGLTGHLPQNLRVPTYGDFDCVNDYQTALAVLTEAQVAFMKLPADVRSRFENDPGKFVDFASDPANLDECRKLGLAPPGTSPPDQAAPHS